MPKKRQTEKQRVKSLQEKIAKGENLVSQADFARLMGFKPPYVVELKKKTPSPLVFDGAKIKYKESRENLEARSMVDSVNRPNRKTNNAATEGVVSVVVPPDGQYGGEVNAETLADMTPHQLALVAMQGKAAKDYFAGLSEEQEFRVRQGELVEQDQVTEEAFRAARTLRERLGVLPKRLAPILAGKSDQFDVYTILEKEIKGVMLKVIAELEDDG